MLKKTILSPRAVAHRRSVLIREAMLLLTIFLVAQLLQIGGHQMPVLVLDGFLICAGLFGLLMSIFLVNKIDRLSFIALFATTLVAGAIQLLWSSGMAISFVVLIAALTIGDALANLFILGRHIFQNGRRIS